MTKLNFKRSDLCAAALFGALLFFVAAFSSVGILHFDEHFQILEFLSHKLHGSAGEELAWEFKEQIRPWTQVGGYYFLAAPLKSFISVRGIEFLFRLLSSLLFLGALSSIFVTFEKDIKNKWAYLLTSLFLWFMPYLSARISSEVVAGAIGAIGVGLLIRKKEVLLREMLLISFLFTLCFYIRFHMAFLLIALLAHGLVFKTHSYKTLFSIVGLSGLFLIPMLLIDYWGYGSFVFTPWNYFEANILKGIAAKFGVLPFWWYFYFAQRTIGPGMGVVVLLSVLWFWARNPRHVITWMTLFFVLIHSLIGHKELRFIFPIVFFIPYILIKTFEDISIKVSSLNARRALAGLLLILGAVNLIYLIAAATRPSHQFFAFHHHMQGTDAYEDKTIFVRENEVRPEDIFHLKINFYGPWRYQTQKISGHAPESGLYYTGSGREFVELLKTDECELLYPHYSWFLEFQYGFKLKKRAMSSLWNCRTFSFLDK